MKETVEVVNKGLKLLQGNQACVEGAIASGCRFFAGYPITPATEIAEYMSERLPGQKGGTFMQMEDELASICAIIGARWGGILSMTATSGPGFSLMQEGIGYAVLTETPTVIVNVQRGGPSTGQPTIASNQDIYQARYGSHGDYELIVLVPSSVQEMFDFTVKAFNLSEKFRVPVILLADEIVSHMREKIRIPEKIELVRRASPPKCEAPFKADERLIPPSADFFQGHNLLIDGQMHDEKGTRAGHEVDASRNLIERLNRKITCNIDEITDIETLYLEDSAVAIVSYGVVSRSALSAVKRARNKGSKVGWVKINTIWPFPEDVLKDLLRHVETVIVPEMNIGKYFREIRGVLPGKRIVSYPLVGGGLHRPGDIEELINMEV
ncbi:MAG: 2-oxoacid:acceptor oxidoreductase subunit alpha [Synergistota bacterium]|nr:2-oxoacid:acceptor oxidoreductase subunit alpha [Synergistota bacterium]